MKTTTNYLAPVVLKLDNAIQRISAREIILCYSVDSDLSGGQPYPPFGHLGSRANAKHQI